MIKDSNVLKFLPGILLLQIVTVALILLAPTGIQGWEWLRVLIPLVVVGVLTSFWFNAVEGHHHKDEIMRLKEQHAEERERLRVNAERAKTRAVKDTQKEITKEMSKELTRSSAKANFKVGVAVAGVASFGAFLLMTQFLTLGVTLLATAGGTAGGYVLRMRHEKQRLAKENEQTAVLLPEQPKQILLPKNRSSSA
jgi:fatty acid desaturase